VGESRLKSNFSYCSITDKDGDQVYSRSERAASPGEPGAAGRGQYVAGTGKYKGIRGEYTFTVAPAPSAEPNVIRITVGVKGKYEIP
jgi:hypothetical protein